MNQEHSNSWDRNERTYYQSILHSEDTAFRGVIFHFRIVAFLQVLDIFSSFCHKNQQWSKATFHPLFDLSKIIHI